MSNLIATPSPQLFHAQQIEILLRGVSRGMNLLATVPELFRARHWPHHEDAIAVVQAACCFYRWGQVSDPRAFDNRFRLPPGAAFDDGWRKLYGIGRPTARQIVDTLDLGEMFPTSGVAFSPLPEPEAADEPLVTLERG